MNLTQYKSHGAKNNGGVASIALVNAADILQIEYHYPTDSFKNLVLKAGKSSVACEFVEDQAQLSEEVSLDKGAMTVKHELAFTLDAIDAPAREFVAKLIQNRSSGVVAIVTTHDEQQFLVGYSRDFGCERPLKVVSAVASSKQLYAHKTDTTITLQSTDNALAKVVI